jgi:hypothetical protein
MVPPVFTGPAIGFLLEGMLLPPEGTTLFWDDFPRFGLGPMGLSLNGNVTLEEAGNGFGPTIFGWFCPVKIGSKLFPACPAIALGVVDGLDILIEAEGFTV